MRPPDRATIRTELPAPAGDLFGFLDLSRDFSIEANTFIMTSVTSTDSNAHGQQAALSVPGIGNRTQTVAERGIRTQEDSYPT